MSAPIEPTRYDIEVFPLGQSGALGSDQWIEWGEINPTFGALTVSFVNGLAVKSIWFPDPQGPMSFYAGDTATGTPFYVTSGDSAEMVAIPNDAPVVTITGPAAAFFFYASTYGFSPFKAATPPSLNLETTVPIVNLGSPSEPNIGLLTPLAVIYGGSGTSDPSLIAGANVTILGDWPDQTISVSTGAGGVQSVAVNAPITLGGSSQNPVIGMVTPLPIADGGTGVASAWAKGGTGIDVNGVSGVDDSTFQWIINNDGVLEIVTPDTEVQKGNVHFTSSDGSVGITGDGSTHVDFSVQTTQALGKLSKLTGTNPAGSLSLTLPAGTWLLESYAAGLDASEGDAGMTATITLSTGPHGGMDGSQYTRYVGVADRITTGGATVTATLTTAGGVTVNTNSSDVFFVFKATLVT